MSAMHERLKEACGTKIKRAHLAKICGVSRTAAGKWFTGGGIEAENIFPIADYCKVEARWLALGEGPKRPTMADPAAKHLWELWSRIDDFTKGEIVRLAIERAGPPGGAAIAASKSA